MRLSKHQRKVIQAIADGQVYDIPSYLKVFNKCHLAQYEFEVYQKQFEEDQKGKLYRVVTKPDECYSESIIAQDIGIFGKQSLPFRTKKPFDQIPDDAWEWEPAALNDNIEPVQYTYNDETFSFDFKKGVSIADSYEDIIDFLTLWSYLSEQKLVLNIPKNVSETDIACFFVEKTIKPNRKTIYNKSTGLQLKYDPNHGNGLLFTEETTLDKLLDNDLLEFAPVVKITSYLDKNWVIDENHLKSCEDYLNKKMIPNSDLRLFIKQHYKTTEEWHYYIPLVISLIALSISLLQSVIPSEEEAQLRKINSEVEEIQQNVSDAETSREKQLDDINNQLKSIKTNMDHVESVMKSIEDMIDRVIATNQ